MALAVLPSIDSDLNGTCGTLLNITGGSLDRFIASPHHLQLHADPAYRVVVSLHRRNRLARIGRWAVKRFSGVEKAESLATRVAATAVHSAGQPP